MKNLHTFSAVAGRRLVDYQTRSTRRCHGRALFEAHTDITLYIMIHIEPDARMSVDIRYIHMFVCSYIFSFVGKTVCGRTSAQRGWLVKPHLVYVYESELMVGEKTRKTQRRYMRCGGVLSSTSWSPSSHHTLGDFNATHKRQDRTPPPMVGVTVWIRVSIACYMSSLSTPNSQLYIYSYAFCGSTEQSDANWLMILWCWAGGRPRLVDNWCANNVELESFFMGNSDLYTEIIRSDFEFVC